MSWKKGGGGAILEQLTEKVLTGRPATMATTAAMAATADTAVPPETSVTYQWIFAIFADSSISLFARSPGMHFPHPEGPRGRFFGNARSEPW